MRILIVSKFNHHEIKETQLIPREGDRIDIFYRPYPSVTGVLLWPSKETTKIFSTDEDIDAIITVE